VERVKKYSGGFTLIEILVTLAILGIVIVPVIGLFSSSVENNYKTNRDIIALTVARDIMDRIKTGDINRSNLEQEINNYKDRYGVEIKVEAPESTENNNLSKIKVYVTPWKGMDAQTQGLMLASYSTNVFIESIDTSPPGNGGGNGGGNDNGGGNGGGGIGEPPPPGGNEDDYWDWFHRLLRFLRAVGVIILALTIIPLILWLKVPELHKRPFIDAIKASYDILVYIHNTYGLINWGHFKNEVRNRYGISLTIRDLFGF
jgi:prepilin-type N-terminal cleavage/methylation domain-containing protein